MADTSSSPKAGAGKRKAPKDDMFLCEYTDGTVGSDGKPKRRMLAPETYAKIAGRFKVVKG